MKLFSYVYPIFAVFCLSYWVIWFIPESTKAIGIDGTLFLYIGIISLWLFPVFLLAWILKSIRNAVILDLGKEVAVTSFLIILGYFSWGSYLLLDLHINGV